MTDRIKILHLIATNFVGGPEKQILNHLKYYDKDKYRIDVGSYIERGQANEFLNQAQNHGVPFCAIEHRSLLDFSPIGAIVKYIMSNAVDIIITHGYKSNIFGYQAKKRAKIPQAMYVRGWTAENIKVKMYNRAEGVFLKRADLIITVAKRKMDELERSGISPGKLRYVSNAIELPDLDTVGFRKLSDDYEIPQSPLVMLAAGRLSPEKGHGILLKALSILQEQGVDFYCIIFGDGPLRQRLENNARELGIDSRVKFAGFVKDWQKYLHGDILLVNPSNSEVMPNVVLEGMAYRCPVLATDVGGVNELIIDNETGLLVPAGDPGKLAEKMLYFANSKDKLKHLAVNARNHAEKNFSYTNQARALESVYDDLYARKADVAR